MHLLSLGTDWLYSLPLQTRHVELYLQGTATLDGSGFGEKMVVLH